MAQPRPSLVYRVRRQAPEVVAPAKPTPRELKPLSGLDDQEGHRVHIPLLFMYRNNPSMEGNKDPVRVLREAIAQTLVFYYPFAGRLREGPGRKLSVDCTAEGVVFVEADADVALDDFGAPLRPPFPCLEELLCHAPLSSCVLNLPLLLFQVTRMKCGGFILGVHIHHTMSDGYGMKLFMETIGDIARGALAPHTTPCWCRDLFFQARDPPRVTHPYRDDDSDGDTTYVPFHDIIEKSFFFGPSQISALRRLVPRDLLHCSTFDILTSCLWVCHTTALTFDSKDETCLIFLVNARGLHLNPPLPPGYYGNAAVVLVVTTAAENLCLKSFGYALELIRKAKAGVTEEYIRSYVDLIAVKGFYPLPELTRGRCLFVSDIRGIRISDVDFGWGRAAYGGPVFNATEAVQGLTAYYTPCKNQQGEEEIVVKMSFPRPAMKIFENQLHSMLFDETKALSIGSKL